MILGALHIFLCSKADLNAQHELFDTLILQNFFDIIFVSIITNKSVSLYAKSDL